LDKHEGWPKPPHQKATSSLEQNLAFPACFSTWQLRNSILHESTGEGMMINSPGKQRCIEPDEMHHPLVFFFVVVAFYQGHPVVFFGRTSCLVLSSPAEAAAAEKGSS